MTSALPTPSRVPRARRRIAALLAGMVGAGGAVVGLPLLAAPVAAAEHGTLTPGSAPSKALGADGAVDYTVYLPPGYDADTERRYPTVYLLHGRGDTQAAWQRVATDLDDLIATDAIQPMVVVMPDAPWNDRGSWYTDSAYTGSGTAGSGDTGTAGFQVETALSRDLVQHVDATYRTVADREARAVGGYSMGGAGALRLTLAHQDEFSAGIVLSPAVYVPQPPADSSVRDHGGYGVGTSLFDEDRYTELSYPAALAALDPALPVHLFVAVGDDEWANPDPAEASHDIDFESARLYNTARRVPGVTAELRVMNGGHDWDVWQPAFREAIVDVSARLRTEPTAPWDAELLGSAGDDRAGGVLPLPDGGTTVALNLAGAWAGSQPAGGLDVVLARRDAAGATVWRHQVATAADDRAYGVVAGRDGTTLVAGYTKGDLDGKHAGSTRDDGFAAAVTATGDRAWTLQTGDPAAADRFYAVTSDGSGGAFVAGYTSGTVPGGTSAGDKDALVGRVSATGELLWLRQVGGPGEDKALAVAPGPDGSVYVGGVAGQGMPGAQGAGANDGWVARYDASGALSWMRGVATSANDQVSGLVARADGSVVAVGHTRGSLGGESAGDNDVFARAFDVAGGVLWTTQTGTATDDRGVTGVAGAEGTVLVVGTTYGSMGTPVGGVDVFTLALAADGAPGAVTQLGTRERDGADEWDDANLFAATAPGAEGAWLSGLTFGAPAGAVNAGAGDVFVSRVAFETGPPTPATAVTVEATARCVGGTARVAVRALNGGDHPATVEVSTPFGGKRFTNVQAGKSASQTFSSRERAIDAGTVTATVREPSGAVEVRAPYAALDCGA
ncbi:alpha/beta hydrolase-fold protein [Oerskovia turbata]